MKGTLKIVGILLLFMFSKAEKCSDGNENTDPESQISNMKREIKSQFDTDSLGKSSLLEYEKAAKLKLTDFVDYLSILADSSLQLPHREKAGEMIRSLFISDSVPVKIISGHDRKDHEFSVGQLVECGLNNELFISRMVYDSVHIDHHFSSSGPDSYSAILSFAVKTTDTRDSVISGTTTREVSALITKEYKVFAPDTLSVWVLHLGEIK
jgi:hypothetical protein